MNEPRSDADSRVNLRDGFRENLGTRIGQVVDMFPTKREAAKVAGVTAEQLRSYISGRSKPPFEVISRMAAEKGVSLNWMAIGQLPQKCDWSSIDIAAVDEALLAFVLEQCETYLEDRGRNLDPRRKAALVTMLYAELQEQATWRDDGVIAKLRRLEPLLDGLA